MQTLERRERELGFKVKGAMDIVVPRVDKSLWDKATIVLLGMKSEMSTPNLLSLGLVRKMRVGALPIEIVAISVMRMFI